MRSVTSERNPTGVSRNTGEHHADTLVRLYLDWAVLRDGIFCIPGRAAIRGGDHLEGWTLNAPGVHREREVVFGSG